MTTNVRDSKKGCIASDSRWTWDLRPLGHKFQLLLDDSGYEKIISDGSCVYMFAGDSAVIDKWKTAVRQAKQTGSSIDWASLPVNGMAISIVELMSGHVRYEFGHEISLQDASFAGTGSYAAAGCWQMNGSAAKAVETAKTTDPHTGGTVRYVDVTTGTGNLVSDVPLQSMIPQFLSRSIVMTANTTQATTFGASASANDETLRAAISQASAQGLAPKAPCDAVFNQWPDNEREKLVEAMKKLFPN